MTATVSPARLTAVLAAAGGIYTAQSLIGGLTFMGVPTVLRASDVALDRIGLVSLTMLVWALKFLWSPPVERWRIRPDGRRRSREIILAGEGMAAILLLALAFADIGRFELVLEGLLVLAVVAATVDIACDAFLIEQAPPDRRGFANIAQVGGGYLGMIFGSGLFVVVYSASGWPVALAALAALLVALSLPMAFVAEPVGTPRNGNAMPALKTAFARPEIRIGLAITVVFEMGGRFVQMLTGPFLVDAGVSLSVIGVLNGVGGIVAGIVGAVAGGFVVQAVGAARAVLIVAALQICVLASLCLAISTGLTPLEALIALFILESAVMAAGFVVVYSRLMALVDAHQPGVDFTLFQSASAIGAAAFGMGGGLVAAHAGYAAGFGMAALFAAIALPLLRHFDLRLNKENTA